MLVKYEFAICRFCWKIMRESQMSLALDYSFIEHTLKFVYVFSNTVLIAEIPQNITDIILWCRGGDAVRAL